MGIKFHSSELLGAVSDLHPQLTDMFGNTTAQLNRCTVPDLGNCFTIAVGTTQQALAFCGSCRKRALVGLLATEFNEFPFLFFNIRSELAASFAERCNLGNESSSRLIELGTTGKGRCILLKGSNFPIEFPKLGIKSFGICAKSHQFVK